MHSLEDGFSDVISKAQRGLELSTTALAQAAQLNPQTVRSLRSGEWTPKTLAAAAGPLGLRAEGLQLLAEGRYEPEVPALAGLRVFDTAAPTTGYTEMRVNACLVAAPAGEGAVLFDTGTEFAVLVEALEALERPLRAVFITHPHWDHVEVLDDVRARWPEAAVYGPEGAGDARLADLGARQVVEVAGLSIEARPTPGHAAHASSYLVRGLARPLAIVGDALFAGSIGGIPPELYAAGLAAIRHELLTLPDDTLVVPGHGLVTTIGYERLLNPFFPNGEDDPAPVGEEAGTAKAGGDEPSVAEA